MPVCAYKLREKDSTQPELAGYKLFLPNHSDHTTALNN